MNHKSYKTIGTLLLIAVTLLVVEIAQGFAQTWFAAGDHPQDYDMGGDPTVSHGAENGGFIRSKVSIIDGFGTWMTRIDPGQYLGKGIRLTAYVKTANLQEYDHQHFSGRANLWMRVDGSGNQTLSFDNMRFRPITGTTDWEEYKIVLDVPENSVGIFFGISLGGTGEAHVDGLQLEPAARTWFFQSSGISEYIHCIKAVDENTVWAGAENGIYLRTTDGGANWTSGTFAGPDTVSSFSIAAIDQNTAYFLAGNWEGGDARIYKTSDGGVSWTLQYHNTSPHVFFNSIAFWDQSHGIAVGDPHNGSFEIVTTTDGGLTWNQVPAANIPAPLPGEWGGVTGGGGTSLAVAGTSHAWFGTGNASPLRVLRSTDQGHTWTAVNTPLSASGDGRGIETVVFKDSLNGFAGGFDYPYSDSAHTLVRTGDGGKSWTAVSSFPPIYPATLAYVPHSNNSVLFVTSAQGSAYSEDGGATWEVLSTQRYYFAMSFASPTAGWAAELGPVPGRIVKFAGSLRTAIVERQHAQPKGFRLAQNYPNPFWSETTSRSARDLSTVIQYQIPIPVRVKLTIYNVLGEKIRTLVDSNEPMGIKQVTWDGRNELGQRVASGVYLYRLEAGDFTMTRRLMLMK